MKEIFIQSLDYLIIETNYDIPRLNYKPEMGRVIVDHQLQKQSADLRYPHT
jgi:hypothetical protein